MMTTLVGLPAFPVLGAVGSRMICWAWSWVGNGNGTLLETVGVGTGVVGITFFVVGGGESEDGDPTGATVGDTTSSCRVVFLGEGLGVTVALDRLLASVGVTKFTVGGPVDGELLRRWLFVGSPLEVGAGMGAAS